ncbi:far upstream element-binding protein 2-like [Phoenix dactylifera]|uniref:Far upstream element-binding protein 2-like n=1 Tax=Phoenix dactylifera TaxID=42345 RepID=A0A8B7BFZ7_PHODC|nr:far upstream element-binding protein 2-like [Phoenix dactylifera]
MADSDAPASPAAAEAIEELVKGADGLQDDAAATVESSKPSEIAPAAPDHKRKLGDLEPHDDEETPLKKKEVSTDAPAPDAGESGPEAKEIAASVGDAELPRPEGEIDGSVPKEVNSDDMRDTEPKPEEIDADKLRPDEGTNELAADGVQKSEAPSVNGELSLAQNVQQAPAENFENPASEVSQQGSLPSAGQQPSVELETTSRTIQVPNSKVGVLIGKAGDTIRYLQINSGAKIQITRDADADPHFSTRPVELIGSLENINKADQLIKDVIAEADAGGSPSLVARGFSTVQSGSEQTEIKVPNEKVGLIIGKGGETIKNLQTRSGARIQLIPQHLPEGDSSKERTVRITGNKKHIESAKEMIKEVMNQVPTRPSPLSGGYSQQVFRPHGPATTPQWGHQATVPTQRTTGYDYRQRGTYPPPQTTQYPQPYGSYSRRPPPRGGYSAGWDQRPAAPAQSTYPSGGYDYYGQGGQATENLPSNPMPNPSLVSTPVPVNYNYGQSQAPAYGQPTPYADSAPTQQNYGHGYNEPKYDNQAPSQQFYGQQSLSSQPGVYGQQASVAQPGYGQQQTYSKPSYGAAAPQEMPPSYGPPRASQPGDPMYQGPAPSYGSGAPAQSYPYGSTAPPQQPAPGYNQTYGPASSAAADGYAQPPSAGYPQHGGLAAPGYGGQPVAGYTQPGSQTGGYGQYPSSQQGYGEPISSNMNYGYHSGSADAGHSSAVLSSGYGASLPASGQPGYAQAPPNPLGYYEQSVPPQSGFAGHPGTAPVGGYVKSLSPQPGYGGQ